MNICEIKIKQNRKFIIPEKSKPKYKKYKQISNLQSTIQTLLLLFMEKNHIFCLILAVSALLVLTNQRLYEQQLAFPMLRRNKGWTFLDRIKLGEGSAQIRFKARMVVKQGQTTKTYAVQLSMVPDRLWATQQLMKCSRDGTSEVVPSDSSRSQPEAKQTIFTAALTPQNKYEFGMLQVVSIPMTETYHFILKDCQKQLISDYFSRESRLLVEMEIKNNGRDYGQDEGGNFFWFPILIIGTIAMLYIVNKSFKTKAIDAKDTDYVKYLVYSCIWINLISLIFKYMGYLIYYYAGVEYSFFDFMYLFFHSVGDSVIVSIFIFVSFGWTITFIHGKDFDLYVPLLCMMGLITVILTLLNKITDGVHDKYHMYDTIPSYLLVFFKALTIIIFLFGCIKTIYQAKKQPKVRVFMVQICVLGSLYILSVPLIMLIVEYIPPSQRKEWVFIFIELGKTFINFLLAYMISYKKSGYRLITFNEQSFMQEGDRIL